MGFYKIHKTYYYYNVAAKPPTTMLIHKPHEKHSYPLLLTATTTSIAHEALFVNRNRCVSPKPVLWLAEKQHEGARNPGEAETPKLVFPVVLLAQFVYPSSYFFYAFFKIEISFIHSLCD